MMSNQKTTMTADFHEENVRLKRELEKYTNRVGKLEGENRVLRDDIIFLDKELDKLSKSLDIGHEELFKMTHENIQLLAKLVSSRRWARAWKQAATRWRRREFQMSMALDHTASNFEDLYGSLIQERVCQLDTENCILRDEVAILDEKLGKLSLSLDIACHELNELSNENRLVLAKLVSSRRWARAWKQAATRWRRREFQMSMTLDHTMSHLEDLYGLLTQELDIAKCWGLLWKRAAKEHWRISQAVKEHVNTLKE